MIQISLAKLILHGGTFAFPLSEWVRGALTCREMDARRGREKVAKARATVGFFSNVILCALSRTRERGRKTKPTRKKDMLGHEEDMGSVGVGAEHCRPTNWICAPHQGQKNGAKKCFLCVFLYWHCKKQEDGMSVFIRYLCTRRWHAGKKRKYCQTNNYPFAFVCDITVHQVLVKKKLNFH